MKGYMHTIIITKNRTTCVATFYSSIDDYSAMPKDKTA
jgi:hypothetical protein